MSTPPLGLRATALRNKPLRKRLPRPKLNEMEECEVVAGHLVEIDQNEFSTKNCSDVLAVQVERNLLRIWALAFGQNAGGGVYGLEVRAGIWYGGGGRVVGIDWSNSELRGQLPNGVPDEMGQFEKLMHCNLNHNPDLGVKNLPLKLGTAKLVGENFPAWHGFNVDLRDALIIVEAAMAFGKTVGWLVNRGSGNVRARETQLTLALFLSYLYPTSITSTLASLTGLEVEGEYRGRHKGDENRLELFWPEGEDSNGHRLAAVSGGSATLRQQRAPRHSVAR